MFRPVEDAIMKAVIAANAELLRRTAQQIEKGLDGLAPAYRPGMAMAAEMLRGMAGELEKEDG